MADRETALIFAAAAEAALCALLQGCAAADPASRSNRTDYGGVCVRMDGRNNSVTLTIGDGPMATADSNGSTETQAATPTVSVPTTVTLPAAADPLTAGIQAAGEVAKEAVKASARGADCPGGECGTR